jgi:hypothetical protein
LGYETPLIERGPFVLGPIGGQRMILCECGEFVEGCTFKAYIKTTANPSTSTIGHRNCGLIFDFLGGKMPKRYSSKKDLKIIAMKFAEIKKLDYESIERFLIEVDRIKSYGKLSDGEVLVTAFRSIMMKRGEY